MTLLNLSELSLFLPDNVYLIKEKEEILILNEKEEESLEEEIVEDPLIPKLALQTYKSVLFLTDEMLNGNSLDTFQNISGKALGLPEDDYTLLSQDQVNFEKIEELSSQKIVSFGIPFSSFTTKYKVYHLEEKLFLYTDSLAHIAENVEMKRQLWAQLQLMFPRN